MSKRKWSAATPSQRRLLLRAAEVRKRAHAPYSRYKVGAAIETTDGKVFTGCNVEDVSWSTSCCSERVALFKAVSEGSKKLARMAVVSASAKPCPPCGTCRQALVEFARDMEIIMGNTRGAVKVMHLKDLLPESFRTLK